MAGPDSRSASMRVSRPSRTRFQRAFLGGSRYCKILGGTAEADKKMMVIRIDNCGAPGKVGQNVNARGQPEHPRLRVVPVSGKGRHPHQLGHVRVRRRQAALRVDIFPVTIHCGQSPYPTAATTANTSGTNGISTESILPPENG